MDFQGKRYPISKFKIENLDGDTAMIYTESENLPHLMRNIRERYNTLTPNGNKIRSALIKYGVYFMTTTDNVLCDMTKEKHVRVWKITIKYEKPIDLTKPLGFTT
jgi:hypothetical protein